MRRKERIDIFLKYARFSDILFSIYKIYNREDADEIEKVILANIKDITKYWKKNPDLRFSQVLVNLFIIPNIPGLWYYIEEDEILKILGIPGRNYLLWGIRFFKNGNLRANIKWVTISNLKTSHLSVLLNDGWTKSEVYNNAFAEELRARGINNNN